ncbi:serine hydrolase domain-containing protein [Bacteroidota bacterium]
MKTAKMHLLLLFIALGFLSCTPEQTNGYTYDIPVPGEDGWEVISADEVGLNIPQLEETIDYINATAGHNIHSILIFKDDKLVFEKYFEGYLYSTNPPGSNGEYILYNKETDHYLASVSKSVTSVIFGAAVKEGFIDDVDERLVDVLPEYKDTLTGDKAEITLKHLLTMSSGLHWDEWSTSFENPENDVVALFNEADPIAYILSKFMIGQPGQYFLYNSGGTNVLGLVIERKTGMEMLDFGNAYLFDPLDVQGGLWETIAGGYIFASGGLYLRPRELSKIGYLFLNKGYWKDTQVITEEWITESTTSHIQPYSLIPEANGYGYQWWIMDFQANGQNYDCFFAAGWGDQYMFIFPEQGMIITFNCGNFLQSGSMSIFDLVESYLLPAIIES